MPSEAGKQTTSETLRRGREAWARSAWAETFAALRQVVDDPAVTLDDLEHLAISAELVGQSAEGHEVLAEAHHRAAATGDPCRAALLAFWLAYSLMDKGEPARGSGWLARVSSIIESSDVDCVAAGYVLLPGATELLYTGDPATALERYGEAAAIAERFHDLDLATFARLGRGSALVELGRLDEGLPLLDEAMVAVSEGEVSPVVNGIVYCATIDRCRRIYDLRRAQEWTAALDRWLAAHPDVVPFRGQCLVFRADLLHLRGDWDAAWTATEQAHIRLAEPPPEPALGAALYQEGELHRLRGRPAEAEQAYTEAAGVGPPGPARPSAGAARPRPSPRGAGGDGGGRREHRRPVGGAHARGGHRDRPCRRRARGGPWPCRPVAFGRGPARGADAHGPGRAGRRPGAAGDGRSARRRGRAPPIARRPGGRSTRRTRSPGRAR